MSRLLKILLAVIAVVVVLVLGIAVAVMLLVDPNEYRGEIAAVVEEQTGRAFSIDGELGLRVLPCCAVAIDDTRLGNPAGFDEPDFASVSSVRLGLQLMPLLFEQRIVVDEVTLDGLTVNLLRLADGSANWEFDTGATAQEAPAEPEAAEAELPELSVAGVNISGARLEYRDEQAGTHVAVEELNVTTGPVAANEPIDIDASVRVRDFGSDATIDGAFTSGFMFSTEGAVAELMSVDSKLDIAAPDLPEGGMAVTMRGAAIRADLNSGAATLEDIVATVNAAGVTLDLTAAGSVQGEEIALSGKVTVPSFSPRDVLAHLGEPPIETADPTVLTAMEMTSDWSLGSERLAVESLRMQLDDSQIAGELSTNYASASDTRFNFELDAIDIDRYLVPAEEEAAASGGEVAPDTEIPIETLRGLDVSGRAAIGELKMGGLTLQNVAANIDAGDGVVRIDPSSADVYGGRYEGTVRIDANGDAAKVALKQTLSQVQTGGILQDLYETENLQGLLQANIDAAGSGRTTNELMRSLKGSVVLDLDDAVYQGKDFWYEIRKAVARIKGKPAPETPADPQTQITALGFAGQLSDGVLRSDKLIAEIPFLRVQGGGALNLLENQLDYRLNAKMLSRPNFPDADDLADLERLTIPITVKGDTADPTIGVDLEELAKDAAVQKAKDKILEKLGLDEPADAADTEGNATDQGEKKDDARDLLKKGLRDLFDR